MVDWNASIKRPFLDIKNLLIGIVLSILPIVRWFAQGYALETSGLTKKRLPINKSHEWGDWWNLFVKGFLASVISAIYLLPALVAFLIGAFSALATILASVEPSSLVNIDVPVFIQQNWDVVGPAIMLALPFVLIAGLLALLAFYVVPAAVMNYLNYDRFSKAFSIGDVFKKAFTGVYFIAVLLTTAITLVLALILNWIPWVGGAASFFISSVITYTVFGQVYKEVKK